MNTDQLVAFCDLLGTAARIKSGSFSPLTSLDFANPIGVAAMDAPGMRFAVFSDSCIISCPPEDPRALLSVLTFLSRNWHADGMLVRGGVALGAIDWVDHPTDKLFDRLQNLSLSRVFGAGLVDAYETERKSGPGAVIFVHSSAERLFHRLEGSFVIPTTPPILNCYDEHFAQAQLRGLDILQSHPIEDGGLRQRQVNATRLFLAEVVRLAQCLPNNFGMEVLGNAPVSKE